MSAFPKRITNPDAFNFLPVVQVLCEQFVAASYSGCDNQLCVPQGQSIASGQSDRRLNSSFVDRNDICKSRPSLDGIFRDILCQSRLQFAGRNPIELAQHLTAECEQFIRIGNEFAGKPLFSLIAVVKRADQNIRVQERGYLTRSS